MAIAFDAAGGDARIQPGTSLTFAHTCSAGSDRLLVVSTYVDGGTADPITGVTYNGVAMTLVAKLDSDNAGNFSYMFYLLNPASGANNVVISSSASLNIYGESVSYTGVKQSAQPDNSTSQKSTGTTITTNLTTVDSDCWTVLATAGDRACAASTGSTYRVGNTLTNVVTFDSNGPVSGATSMEVTRAAGGANGFIMASFAPTASAAVASRSNNLMLLGVS